MVNDIPSDRTSRYHAFANRSYMLNAWLNDEDAHWNPESNIHNINNNFPLSRSDDDTNILSGESRVHDNILSQNHSISYVAGSFQPHHNPPNPPDTVMEYGDISSDPAPTDQETPFHHPSCPHILVDPSHASLHPNHSNDGFWLDTSAHFSSLRDLEQQVSDLAGIGAMKGYIERKILQLIMT